jgi:hypothetical protein
MTVSRVHAGGAPVWRLLVAAVPLVVAGCNDGPCDRAIEPLAALSVETVKGAAPDQVKAWRGQLDAARKTCTAEKHQEKLERIRDVDLAITMRSADLAIEEGQAVQAKAAAPVSSNRVAVPSTWPVNCVDVVREGAFAGLLAPGIPREVARHLATGTKPAAPAGDADAGAPPTPTASAAAGAPAPGATASGGPDEALVLAGRPVYLTARGGKLEGAMFEDGAFKVQQQLAWPAEAAEGGAVSRIVAAKGPDVLGVAWIADLSVWFATLDVGTETWTAAAEIPVSGDDGGRDLVLGDLTWGRASFGLVLGTERGFAFVEILPSARAVRPAALQPAYVVGRPRIAWDGSRFVVVAGRDDGVPSIGFWRAPDGSSPAQWIPLVDELPRGATLLPLDGELIFRDGSTHIAFRVSQADTPTTYLGHALPGGPSAVETCP